MRMISNSNEIQKNRALLDSGVSEIRAELVAVLALVTANQALCKHKPKGPLSECSTCGKIMRTDH